jgi:hypothetical protein
VVTLSGKDGLRSEGSHTVREGDNDDNKPFIQIMIIWSENGFRVQRLRLSSYNLKFQQHHGHVLPATSEGDIILSKIMGWKPREMTKNKDLLLENLKYFTYGYLL